MVVIWIYSLLFFWTLLCKAFTLALFQHKWLLCTSVSLTEQPVDVCRIRQYEGFHFAASGEGIVSMVMELPMKVRKTASPVLCAPSGTYCQCLYSSLSSVLRSHMYDLVSATFNVLPQGIGGDTDRESHSCIVQYILFPPHTTSTKDRWLDSRHTPRHAFYQLAAVTSLTH